MSASLVARLDDDGFSRNKRQEVRGAPSPPRDPRRRADVVTELNLEPLSNAGWSVQSESGITDGGVTTRADLQGTYDVTGGTGQFVATDNQHQATTDYQDDHSSYKSNVYQADVSKRDHVVQRTEDGATITSSTQHQSHSTVKETSSSTYYSSDDSNLTGRHASDPSERHVTDSSKRHFNDSTELHPATSHVSDASERHDSSKRNTSDLSKHHDSTDHRFSDRATSHVSESTDSNEKLNSDECRLSVSEKVNKFTKGQENRDKSPARNITDEYDKDTVYQDDYTKLSVNDKAHLFVETVKNVKNVKTSTVKVERPDLSNVDEELRNDECLLSVSDKVNKFVKTAEQFLSESQETQDTDKLVKERNEKFIKQLQEHAEINAQKLDNIINENNDVPPLRKETSPDVPSFAEETASSQTKAKDYVSPHIKPTEKDYVSPHNKFTEKAPVGKITALSEAVKKAKALFENKATTQDMKTTKLLDIGIIKESPKTDSTTAIHPSDEESPNTSDSEIDSPEPKLPNGEPKLNGTSRPVNGRAEKPPDSPVRKTESTVKSVLSRYPAARNEATTKQTNNVRTKSHEKVTSQVMEEKQTQKINELKEEVHKTKQEQVDKLEEEIVSTRRGCGKFGIELRRTSSLETITSERRRSSGAGGGDRSQPCIEHIYDVQLLEQMLEKVVGYEKRRRIRCQIRVAKKNLEERTTTTHTKTTRYASTVSKSPERRPTAKSPERRPLAKSPERKVHKTTSPERKPSQHKDDAKEAKLMNGHSKEPSFNTKRSSSPDKQNTRQPSPDKRARPASPNKVTKPKSNRISEYAIAYLKKVGINDDDKMTHKVKTTTNSDVKTGHVKFGLDDETRTARKIIKTTIDSDVKSGHDKTNTLKEETNHFEHNTFETTTKTSKTSSFTERKSSKETMETTQTQVNGKRCPSPQKRSAPTSRASDRSPSPQKRSNQRSALTERLYQRSPSPDFTKTVYEVDSNTKPIDKPSWMTNRNIKKVSSESRTTSSSSVKQSQSHRATCDVTSSTETSRDVTSRSRGRVDAITSGYGPGPLDADGRPLFGIRALRNTQGMG